MTNHVDRQYLMLLKNIIENGTDKGDRTGTGTRSLFGKQLHFDLQKGFPLLTTKKVFTKGIIVELLWLISGSTNIGYMLDHNVHIWDEWTPAFKEGGKERVAELHKEDSRHKKLDLGPVYGQQWRSWETKYSNTTIDQLQNVIDRIKTNPDCRRLIVTAWNPSEIDNMALPPCHCFFQFNVDGDKLNCQLYQRSADVFLGVPFNIASYALLTMMVAQVTGYNPGTFVHTFGDVHIYNNHFEQVKEQLSREPKELPTMKIDQNINNIDEFKLSDFELIDYDPHPAIKAEVSI